MLVYLAKRTAWTVVMMFVISFVTYILFFVVPSDRTRYARRFDTGPEDIRRVVDIHGSIWEEYGTFAWRLVSHGSLGRSFGNREDVSELIARAAPVTMSLVLGSAVIWLLVSFPIGIISALRPRSLLDRAGTILVLVGLSAHPVWIGLGLGWLFGYKLGWFPFSGYCDVFTPGTQCGGPTQWAYHLILPWVTLAALFAAIYVRMIRATVAEMLDEDWVTTARAKGASEWRVVRVHILRNSMLPIVTMIGMDIGRAFAGVVFVESVFGMPGLGHHLVQAVSRNDLPVVIGVTMFVAAAICFLNLLVDVVYAFLDPRLQLEQARPRRDRPVERAPEPAPRPQSAEA